MMSNYCSTVPTPILTMSRDPDISVTLCHGDPLNLTCTIKLDPAIDIDVTVAGTLSGQGIQNPDYDTVLHIPSRVYRIKRTIASLEAARSAVYTCNATVSPGQGVINITSSEMFCRVLNITVGKSLKLWDLCLICTLKAACSYLYRNICSA